MKIVKIVKLVSIAGKVIVCAGFVLSWQDCKAQDPSYIGSFDQKFALRFYVADHFTSTIAKNGSHKEVYKPNNPMVGAVGLDLKRTRLEFMFYLNPRNGSKEKSKTFDLQMHTYGRHMAWDFIGQSYRGFYQKGNDDTFRPELKINKFGVLFQYVFNGDRFSYRAAFEQTEKQLKSAGSFLIGSGLYYTQVKGDSIFKVNHSEPRHHYLFGPSIGYAYTWVIKKQYFLSASLSAGVSMGFKDFKSKVKFYPTYFPRVSAGYNAQTWSVGLYCIYDQTDLLYTKDHKLSLNTESVQITFIKRFGVKK